MPTYEYECGACGYRFEKRQSMTEKAIRKCPKCGKAKAERVISGGAGFLFKGSGFYQTDYRSQSYKDDARKDKPHSPSKESKVNGTSPGNLLRKENGGQDKPHSPSKESKVNGTSPGNLLRKENGGQDKPHSPSKESKVNGTSPGNLLRKENGSQDKPHSPSKESKVNGDKPAAKPAPSCSGDCKSCPSPKA